MSEIAITVYVDKMTYRRLLHLGEMHGSSSSSILSELAQRITTPKAEQPAPPKRPRRPWTRMTPERLAQLHEGIEQGMTVAQLAAHVGVSDATIRNHIKKETS